MHFFPVIFCVKFVSEVFQEIIVALTISEINEIENGTMPKNFILFQVLFKLIKVEHRTQCEIFFNSKSRLD